MSIRHLEQLIDLKLGGLDCIASLLTWKISNPACMSTRFGSSQVSKLCADICCTKWSAFHRPFSDEFLLLHLLGSSFLSIIALSHQFCQLRSKREHTLLIYSIQPTTGSPGHFDLYIYTPICYPRYSIYLSDDLFGQSCPSRLVLSYHIEAGLHQKDRSGWAFHCYQTCQNAYFGFSVSGDKSA